MFCILFYVFKHYEYWLKKLIELVQNKIKNIPILRTNILKLWFETK